MTVTTAGSFRHFPSLPTELRIQIWEMVLCTPRTLSLSCVKNTSDRRNLFAESFSASSPAPAALHVCREARLQGLERYRPSFMTKFSPRYIYVCFAQDTIECRDNLLHYLLEEERAHIETMRLRVMDVEYFSYYNMAILKSISGLRDLEFDIESDATSRESDGVGAAETLVQNFLREFLEEEMTLDPSWCCPRVNLLHRSKNVRSCVLPGRVPASD